MNRNGITSSRCNVSCRPPVASAWPGWFTRVAQICNLPYRRIGFCGAFSYFRRARSFGHPADYKSAIHQSSTLRYGPSAPSCPTSMKYPRWDRLDRSRFRRRRASGIMLVECLVYVAVWFVIASLAFAAFFRVLENARHVRRNASDIERALQAGELWRQEIRKATGPIELAVEQDSAGQTLRIPQGDKEVAYRFAGTNVLRRARADAPWVVALARVQTSRMIEDPRRRVTGWRWEVELKSTRKTAVTKPLFTFVAVPSSKEQR